MSRHCPYPFLLLSFLHPFFDECIYFSMFSHFPLPSPVGGLQVDVVRDGCVLQVSSAELAPGDTLLVSTGVLPCDCVLLKGECIVDENMLTGE
jgi:hypothetical protein